MPRRDLHIEEMPLAEVLAETCRVDELRMLARLVSTGQLPTRKADLIRVFCEAMSTEESLRALWDQLDELQQAAVAETLKTGAFSAASFHAKYGAEPDWGQLTDWGHMERPSLLCAFIHRVEIPADLAERLRRFVPDPEATVIGTVTEPPETIQREVYQWGSARDESVRVTLSVPVTLCLTEQMAQHDLLAVLRLTESGKVRVSDKKKHPTAAAMRALGEVLHGGDFFADPSFEEWGEDPGPVRAFAWPLIAQSAGLARAAGTKLELTAAGRRALSKPPEETLRLAWDRWQNTKLLDEFNRVDTIKGQTGKAKRTMTPPSERREVIVEALRECPVGQWITVDEFSRFMRAEDHSFLVSRDLWKLYLGDAQYGALGYSGFGTWDHVQVRYVLTFLFEYAATMGLIDVAYIHPDGARPDYCDMWGADELSYLSRYDGLQCLRLNSFGAWCLGATEEYVPAPRETKEVLRVLPNMEVVALRRLEAADRLFLDQVAEQTSDAVWRLDATRILGAIEQGASAGDLQEELASLSGGELDAAVVRFVTDVDERASALRDCGPAMLVEARDSALAHLLANETSLRGLCMLAGERFLAVPADSEPSFRKAVRKLGYGLPMRTDA